MKTNSNRLAGRSARKGSRFFRTQRGTAMIIAIMVMALLAIFVAATLSRVTNEALIMGNDQANTAAYFAAQASLEHMSRNFSEIFDTHITPSATDITNITVGANSQPPGYDSDYTFVQTVTRELPVGTPPEQTVVDSGNEFAGLIALRDPWRIETTATSKKSGDEVRLTRTLNNYTIPIFQFGIFYDDPMEHHPGPPFSFGGRVHTNGDIYLMAGNTTTNFRDRVTAAGEVVTDMARNSDPWTKWGSHVRVSPDSGTTYQTVSEGSVTNGPDTPQRIALRGSDDPDLPNGTKNSNWTAFSARFNGNLLANVSPLKLPLQIDANNPLTPNKGPIEIVKRSRVGETTIVRDSRYFNKPGVRVTLSDTQAKLPGGTGGVQLNSVNQPNTVNEVGGGARGYWPTTRADGTRAAKINGERLTAVATRQVWIKVEIVTLDSNLNPVATDYTPQFLSLGMTQQTTLVNGTVVGDPDAIIKIQRYAIFGPPLKVANDTYTSANTARYTVVRDPVDLKYRHAYTYTAGANVNVSQSTVTNENAYLNATEATFQVAAGNMTTFTPSVAAPGATNQLTVTNTGAKSVIPFPIMMFDTREGLYNDSLDGAGWQGLYRGTAPNVSQQVPVNGVMGLIDFDCANFRRLVNGNLDAKLTGLRGTDIPDNGGAGWIAYFSDRRGDVDDDGEYDNENVYVAAANTTAVGNELKGEDVNHDNTVQANYDNGATGAGESATYNTAREADIAALTDSPWFRRAQRLINGSTLPGTTVPGASGLYSGFTFASENGVYVKGDYNATGIATVGSPTPYTDYQGASVPASIVADAVSFLSNEWNDGKSFRWAFDFGTTALGGRQGDNQMTVRCALLMGDALSFLWATGLTNQGGSDYHLAGGVHNFIRFRENWNTRVNYCGSLINLFNSVDNNGTFKCCVHVYGPPTRNWVFDATFLDATRLPPGTPFFQYFNLTGWRRTYRQDT